MRAILGKSRLPVHSLVFLSLDFQSLGFRGYGILLETEESGGVSPLKPRCLSREEWSRDACKLKVSPRTPRLTG